MPSALIQIFARAEWRESLGTSDIELARTRAAIKDAEIAIEIEVARAQSNAEPQTTTVTKEVRIEPPTGESLYAQRSFLSDCFDETDEALRNGHVDHTQQKRERVSDRLHAIGRSVAPNSAAWNISAFGATEAGNSVQNAIRPRIAGSYVRSPALLLRSREPQPSEPVSRSVLPNCVVLGGVIDHYLAGVPENGFKRKVKRCLTLFGEMLGRDLPLQHLNQKVITQFMREICCLPAKWALRFDAGESVASLLREGTDKVMSPTTYEGNYKGPLETFLVSAAQNFGDDGFRQLTVSACRYVGNRVANEDQQRALFDDELKTLFEGEAFNRIAQDSASEPLYWLLAVMLFTGARPREVCQINPQVDFGELEGAWYVDLDDKSPAGMGLKKTIKTGEARRIPLHSELLRLGFVDYLKRQRVAGADRLFPTWRMKMGNPFAAHYDSVGTLLREVGLYSRDVNPGAQVSGAYVLRKTFITKCRDQGVISKEITGHSGGLTTAIQERHYISRPESLRRKFDELKKLVMPVRLPLPRHVH